jgi:hypothetical protein
MAKCKTCGKRGLFLKLQNGVCSACLNSIFPIRIGVAEITKDQFLHPEKYEVKEQPLKRDTDLERPGKITASDGSKIDIGLFDSPFTLEGIKVIDSHFYEITSAENIQRAKADILSLNEHIKASKRYCKTIPEFSFVESKLSFKFDPYALVRRYSILSFSPLTNTGKVSANPVTLHINHSDDLHGRIMYNRSGDINRVEIITSEKKETEKNGIINVSFTAHELIFTKQDGELRQRLIYRNKNGTKTKTYDSKESSK